jgi:N-acetylmuramic acid 6-phosphate (MurNAc-6-P) etherase
LLDALECPPTFGASLCDVRGFIAGGYDVLQNKQGGMSTFFDISTD